MEATNTGWSPWQIKIAAIGGTLTIVAMLFSGMVYVSNIKLTSDRAYDKSIQNEQRIDEIRNDIIPRLIRLENLLLEQNATMKSLRSKTRDR